MYRDQLPPESGVKDEAITTKRLVLRQSGAERPKSYNFLSMQETCTLSPN